MKTALFVGVVVVTLVYLAALLGAVLRARRGEAGGRPTTLPRPLELALGFVATSSTPWAWGRSPRPRPSSS